MTPRSHSGNAFSKPVESGGALSTNEQLRNRMTIIMNTRERVHLAQPLTDKHEAMAQQIETVAAEAAKVAQQGAPIQLTPEIANSMDLADWAKQAEIDAQAAAATEAARQAIAEARANEQLYADGADPTQVVTEQVPETTVNPEVQSARLRVVTARAERPQEDQEQEAYMRFLVGGDTDTDEKKKVA